MGRAKDIVLKVIPATVANPFVKAHHYSGSVVGKAKAGRASAEYAAAFWQAIRSKSVPHEVFNALETGTDSEGGYLVPDEYQRTLIDALQEQNIFRQLAHVITTTSGERKIPVVASHGTAAWIDEEGSYPESDDAFGQVSIGSYKLATMIKVSEELLKPTPPRRAPALPARPARWSGRPSSARPTAAIRRWPMREKTALPLRKPPLS